jgi:uncharacterized SAM-binding protein YcdF (DUF218 family)
MKTDALVVLGCRVGPGGRLSEAARRRVERAAEAWAERPATVWISGGRRWEGIAEAVAMRDAIVSRGVPAGSVSIELLSLSTRENARYTAARLRAQGITRIRLVTCAWHMDRAVARFTAERLVVEPNPAVSPSPPPAMRVYRPVREAVAGWLEALL